MHAARVAVGMSPDSPGPEEIGEVEEVEGGASELMQGVDPVGEMSWRKRRG